MKLRKKEPLRFWKRFFPNSISEQETAEKLRAVNADSLLAACDVLELYNTVDKSEEGVVSADADIVAGMNCGSSLSDDYVAGLYSLSVGLLNAETLCFAVASVLGRTNALLMSEEL